MNDYQEMPEQMRLIAEKVTLLHKSSTKMIEVMENQIDAIIASNTAKIEELASMHASLTVKYTENENEFIQELSNILASEKEQSGIKLVDLKAMFPQFATQIENWQLLLHRNVTKLQEKHRQIIELLEFAMSSNAKMMETLYSKHNEKNAHYSATGARSGMMPGVAINQEA